MLFYNTEREKGGSKGSVLKRECSEKRKFFLKLGAPNKQQIPNLVMNAIIRSS
jgi:hypothetical protein